MANPFVNQSALAAKIQGMREAKAAFQALPQVTRVALNGATETTVREIVRHAQAHLVASPSIRTRSLLNNVTWTMNVNNGRGRVGVSSGSTSVSTGVTGELTKRKVKGVILAGKGGGAAGGRRVFPSVYAHFIEFGTRHSKPEPFMITAAESQKQPYLDRCRAAGRKIETDTAAIGSRTL